MLPFCTLGHVMLPIEALQMPILREFAGFNEVQDHTATRLRFLWRSLSCSSRYRR